VPYAAYGADLTEAMTEIDRSGHLDWPAEVLAPALPALHARLLGDPPARVADIGCGAAWSSIGIALTYPQARVDGFDVDEASVALARGNVVEAGVSDRVCITCRDAGDPALAGSYDLVVVTLSLHDMTDPVAVLRAMRRLAGTNGVVLVVERRAAEHFLDPDTDYETERFFYPWSVLHCLPVGMSGSPAAGIGTLLRPPVLRAFAREAGFGDVEVILPEDAPQVAVYRLLR
jgi:SAM-dependent methyltransferase